MTISELQTHLNAEILCGEDKVSQNVDRAFASDLMSDVLTLKSNEITLITGLCNIQTIRTMEMADINTVIFCRGKKATEDMIEIAKENDMIVLQTDFSMFRTCGVLYEAGIKPVF
jgi:serine kinase of HPr protein (carbohydrate metabolism regulator)